MAVVPPLPVLTSAHPVLPLADCCHWIEPVLPDNDMVVLLPEQTVTAAAAAVPPTEDGITLTTAVELISDAQTPLETMAW